VSGQPAAWLAASVLPPLGALRTAPATARGHVRGTLAVWRLNELTDTVELVVSELTANAVALRYFTVYGPRQRPDMAFSRIKRAALSGRAMSLYGTGAQRRDFTYVSDAVAATIAAATADVRAEVINVASGRSVPLSEARKVIARLAGDEVPAQRRVAQPGDVDVTAADLTRAGELLGYQPAVELEEGLRRQWDWLAARENPAALAMAEAAR
jgi:nucleoside-diphosphate-sugar epimerase